MRSRGTQACTIAEIAKPRTRAHQTSHAIRNESSMPCQMTVMTSLTLRFAPSQPAVGRSWGRS
jgi:hypothetical protein